MLPMILLSMIQASLAGTEAHARGCLVKETELLSSTPSATTCRIVQEPELAEGLFTFPYLGTRSYRVRYWKGEAVQEHFVTRTYVIRIYNRCRGWVVDKDYSTDTSAVSRSFVLENPNLDERIDNEAQLAPVSAEAMQAIWKRTLDRCGYGG